MARIGAATTPTTVRQPQASSTMQSTLNQFFSASKSGVARPSKDVVHMGAAVASVNVEESKAKTNPFDTLPIEMNQRIAEELPDDRSIVAFMRSCRSARDAIEGDGQSFWRRRFLATFERPEFSKSNAEYKQMYIDRSIFNFHMVTFTSGRSTREQRCLEAIRDIIVDSFASAPKDAVARSTYTSSNIAYLSKIIEACPSLLQSIFAATHSRKAQRSSASSQPTTLLQTIQVLMAPRLLDINSELTILGFEASQRAAYLFKPLFKGYHGLNIDMEWVLHQLNFWRYHMVRPEEITLFSAYSQFEESEYPRYWQNLLKNETTPAIGRFWKGSYGFLEGESDVVLMRTRGNPDAEIQDIFCGEDGVDFQDVEVKLLKEGQENWPPQFEHCLQALEEPKKRMKTRAQRPLASPDPATWESRSFRFGGECEDQTGFLADGWLNTLPSQSGVPGWKRMTMMKYFEDEYGNIDFDRLWAYEGVVLPGGQIIVGRWWSPYQTDENLIYSGPFILWCIDTPALLSQHDEKEASPEL